MGLAVSPREAPELIQARLYCVPAQLQQRLKEITQDNHCAF